MPDFLDAHAASCRFLDKPPQSWQELACQRYLHVIEIYQQRLIKDGKRFVKLVAMSDGENPDKPRFAHRFQEEVTREIRLGELYSQLVIKAGTADGADQHYPEQVNALLAALVRRQRPSATPFVISSPLKPQQTAYANYISSDPSYQQAVQREVLVCGSDEAAKLVGKGTSPLRRAALASIKRFRVCSKQSELARSPNGLDDIVREASRRILAGGKNLNVRRPANLSALSCFLCDPLQIVRFAPSSRVPIKLQRVGIEIHLGLLRAFCDYVRFRSEQASLALDVRAQKVVANVGILHQLSPEEHRFSLRSPPLFEYLPLDKWWAVYLKRHVPIAGGVYQLGPFEKRFMADIITVKRAGTAPLARMLSRYEASIAAEEKRLWSLETEGLPYCLPQVAPRSLFNDADAMRLAKELLSEIGALPVSPQARRRLEYPTASEPVLELVGGWITDRVLAGLPSQLKGGVKVISLVDPNITAEGLKFFCSLLPKSVAAVWVEERHGFSQSVTDQCEEEAGHDLACIALKR